MAAGAVVHVIDDDEAVRQSVAFLLASGGFAVRIYESAIAFLGQLDGLQPGCILSDVRMPGLDGLELLRRLKAMGFKLPVIIMTGHADVAMAVGAMKEGASDFIEKPFDDTALFNAINGALQRHQAEGRQDDEVAQIRTRLGGLTERERQVLDGLLAGHPNKTIAYDLSISPRTVEIHRANLMTKMGAGALSELVRMALLAEMTAS